MTKENKLDEIDVTTAEMGPIYHYVCPACSESFNYPAKFTTSIPPFVVDGCPFCGHLFLEGLNENCPAE